MTDEFTARHIRKFDGTNFQGWKFQLNALLMSHGIQDVVVGGREMPEDPASPQGIKWQRDNAKAMFMISASMEYDRFEPLLICKTGKEMWDKLSIIHEQKSESNKLMLTQRFHEYKMAVGETVVQHVAKVQNMAAQLADLGETVSSVAVMAKILSSLSPKYATLQTAWDSVDPSRQTLEHLQERLIREEARFTAENDSSTTALAAMKKEKSKPKTKDRGKRENKARKTNKDIECYKCHGMGHFARECPTKGQGKGNRQPTETRDCAFVAEDKRSERHATNNQVRELLETHQRNVWLTDSGASRHMTFRRDWLVDYKKTYDRGTIALGDDEECEIVGEGTVLIEKLLEGTWREARIENVLYVPKLKKNLFSVGVCTRKKLEVRFKDTFVTIVRDNREIASGVKQENDIWRMFFRPRSKADVEQANVSATSLRVWHERLGHVNKRSLCNLVNKGLVTGVALSDVNDFVCEMCHLGKAHRLPFKRNSGSAITKPGEMFHTDVCGPMSVESPGGSKYFLTFKDDVTGYRHVYFLQYKTDVFEKFKVFERLIANKFGRPMKIIRSDNGREFCNRKMSDYLAVRGIKQETTAPYTPEQNGKAERDNRTIVERARTMLHAKGLPTSLWAEAVNTAVYVLNRTVSPPCEMTPYEQWTGKQPNIKHLRIFGTKAFVHVPKMFTKKFDLRAKRTILVGYESDSENYRVYNMDTKRVSVARNVTFNERAGEQSNESWRQNTETVRFSPLAEEEEDDNEEPQRADAESINNQPKNIEDQPTPDDNQQEEAVFETQTSTQGPSRTLRDRASIKPPARYEVDVAEYTAPNTYEEAMSGEDAAQWALAIQNELRSHEVNCTWTIVPRNTGEKTIDSKWVFKVKQDHSKEGSNLFKARLCARGFLQQRGIDYTDTFAPVVRYDSLRIFLATVAERDLVLLQFDVQTAFLYGDLDERILMEVPKGLNVNQDKSEPNANSVVCKLNKSLYGLKQAPRCWNRKFKQFLDQFKFRSSAGDPCIFIGQMNGEEIYLALFVDDGLVAARSKETLELIKNELCKNFKIKVGNSSIFVGLQIHRDRVNKLLVIHQSLYTKNLLEKYRMCDAKIVSVPADPHTTLYPLDKNDEQSGSVPYREAVGSLVFLATVTRPDIAFAVNAVSKFLNNHGPEHWRAVKRIFAYLKGTIDYGIEYRSGGSESELIGFSDSDYANDIETRRSTTGYICFLSNGPITWSAQRQKMVTLSTTESEYVAASAATKEIMWIRTLLDDVGCSCDKATTLYIDNQSAIRLVKNPEFHKRTKHIDIRYHFIREKVTEGKLVVEYVPTELQRADILTKALPTDRFKRLCTIINVSSTSARRSNGGSVKEV